MRFHHFGAWPILGLLAQFMLRAAATQTGDISNMSSHQTPRKYFLHEGRKPENVCYDLIIATNKGAEI